MATVMEKDVALEMVAATLALTSRKIDADRRLGIPPIEKKLLGIQDYLYSTDYKEIDYDATIKTCQEIRAEYSSLPDKSVKWNPNDN